MRYRWRGVERRRQAVPGSDAVFAGAELGAFRLAERLGVGGMAEVWLAAAGSTEAVELAAVKRLLPHLVWDQEFVRMFVDEVTITAALDHPGIARVLDFGTGPGGYYLAIEYVHGVELRSLLHHFSAETPPLDFALSVVASLADALHYAHEFKASDGSLGGLVHRDVSPSNVMVTYDGVVKLLDFGIARVTDRTRRTRAGTTTGKVGYMAPEQCRADAVDRRTDIFALGVMLYELSTGRRAFYGSNDLAVFAQVLLGRYASPRELNPDIPPELATLIDDMLQVDPDRRPASADVVATRIRALSEHLAFDLSADRRAARMGEHVRPEPYPSVDLDALASEDALGSRSRAPVGLIGLLAAASLVGAGVAIGVSMRDNDLPEAPAQSVRAEPPPPPVPDAEQPEPAVETPTAAPPAAADPMPNERDSGGQGPQDPKAPSSALPRRRMAKRKSKEAGPKRRSSNGPEIDPDSLLAPSFR